LSPANCAAQRDPAERLKPGLDALVNDTEVLFDRVMSGQCCVGGLRHLEQVEHVVVLEQLEEAMKLAAGVLGLLFADVAVVDAHLELGFGLLEKPHCDDLLREAARRTVA
jgi:hypothetical protein